MATNGIITARALTTSGIVRTRLAGEIIRAAAERAILNNDAVVRTYDGGDLEYRLGLMDAVTIEHNVSEGQEVAIETPAFGSVTVPLTKDVAMMGITDEARIRGDESGIDIRQLVMDDAVTRFAAGINTKIVNALDVTPQTGTSFDIRTESIYIAIGEAQSMLPDAAVITAIVTGRQGKVEIMNNLNKVSYGGATPGAPARADMIPGLDIPVFATSAVDQLDGDAIYFVSNQVPGVAWFPGRVKTDYEFDIQTGTDVFKISAWSAAVSNLRQTSTSLNQGVIKTTYTTS